MVYGLGLVALVALGALGVASMNFGGPPDKMNGVDMSGMTQGAQDAMMGLPPQMDPTRPSTMGTNGGR